MMFNRQALLDACKTTLELEKEHHRAQHERDVHAFENAKDEWFENYTQAWLDALAHMKKKLDAGEVIMRSDLPRARDGWSDAATFDQRHGSTPRQPGEMKPFTPSRDVTALIAILEAVTDEKISTNGLKDLGFGTSLLGRVTRQLKAASQ